MPVPINLEKVNISLQQFQEIASGKYNAGEVTLTSESTVGKVNNHVHSTDKNQSPLAHAEIVAVKSAFVRTLSESGVGAVELERIRRELGLAELAPQDKSLKDRIITPLSRQQVREILDRNADAINAAMGAGTIRTAAERNANISEQTLASRAQTRDAVNAALADSREIERHAGLDTFQRIVADDVAPGMPREDRLAMADQAKEVLAKLLHGCNGAPREGCPAKAEWTDPATGAKFAIEACCDEVEFAKRLEDLIVRLQRYEYKAVLTTKEWNREITDSLTDNSKLYKLLPGFRQMAMDAMSQAHAVFGDDGIRQGANLSSLTSGERVLNNAEEALGDVRFTPDNLREPFLRATLRRTVQMFLSNHIAPALRAAGLRLLDDYPLAGNILKNNPDLLDRLVAAKSPAEAKQILADAADIIQKAVDRHVYASQCRAALLDSARAIYSEKTGVPLEMLGERQFDPKALPKRGTKLIEAIDSGARPLTTKEEIAAAFDEIRDSYLDGIFQMQAKIEETDLPRNAKDWMKFQIPGLEKFAFLRPTAIAAAAREIDLSPLEQAFARKAPDDEVLAALRAVADAMRLKVFQIHRAATGEDPGGDQIEPIQALLAKALLAEKPALERQILGFIGREELMERFGEDVEDTRALCAFRALETDDAVPLTWRAWAPEACEKSDGDPKKVDALIAEALAACGDDADVRALVIDNFDHIFVAGNAQLRTAEAVRARVEALKANFAELRQIGAQDPALLASLHGKALPAELLGRLVQAAWEQPNGDMKGLGARSKGMAVHKAVAQFRAGVDRALRESGALAALEGGDELTPCRNFIIRRMLAGIPRRDQEGLRAALRSRNGGKLFRAYRSIGDLAGERPLSEGLRSALVRTGQLLCAQAIDLDVALGQELGHEPSVLPVADPPAPRPESFGAARLIDEMIPVARERIAAETDEAVSAYVKGGGEAATQVRGLFATRLGPEPDSPESTLRDDFQSLVGTMLTRAVLKDMKLFAAGKTTQFDLDLGRNFKIVLQGVGEISTDRNVARDQFARFVTKDPAATYKSLTPSARNKANLAMSLASQGTHNAVAFGFGVLLDPQGRVPAVAFNGDLEERTFTMELDGNGGLAVRFRSRQKPTRMMLNGELTPCGPGSSVRADLDLHVDAQEMERLAALDFAIYDDAPLQKIIDQEQPPEKFRRAKFAIPQPFRLRMDVGPVLVADLK